MQTSNDSECAAGETSRPSCFTPRGREQRRAFVERSVMRTSLLRPRKMLRFTTPKRSTSSRSLSRLFARCSTCFSRWWSNYERDYIICNDIPTPRDYLNKGCHLASGRVPDFYVHALVGKAGPLDDHKHPYNKWQPAANWWQSDHGHHHEWWRAADYCWLDHGDRDHRWRSASRHWRRHWQQRHSNNICSRGDELGLEHGGRGRCW